MSWRRFRNLLLLAAAAAVAYWLYRDRPTPSQFIDDLTRPLLGSHAAVKESERKRVMSDAVNVIGQQTDENVGALREGMSMNEVRELLGPPDRVESVNARDPVRVRWTYLAVKRTILFEDARVASIAVR